jgi:hypothetical protein
MDENQKDEVRLIIYDELGMMLKELYAEIVYKSRSAEEVVHEAMLKVEQRRSLLPAGIRLRQEPED